MERRRGRSEADREAKNDEQRAEGDGAESKKRPQMPRSGADNGWGRAASGWRSTKQGRAERRKECTCEGAKRDKVQERDIGPNHQPRYTRQGKSRQPVIPGKRRTENTVANRRRGHGGYARGEARGENANSPRWCRVETRGWEISEKKTIGAWAERTIPEERMEEGGGNAT